MLVFLAGIYGGYFVAAQGVLLVGILGVFLLAPLQSANAVKNALVAAVNIVAAIRTGATTSKTSSGRCSSSTAPITPPTTEHGRSLSSVRLSPRSSLRSVSYTHLTLPTIAAECRSRWSPYH